MIAILIIAAMIVFVRSLMGWDVPVNSTRYFPRRKARITTLCLCPVFLILIAKCDFRTFGAAWIAYVIVFSIIGISFSTRKVPRQPPEPTPPSRDGSS